jgi:hypothetical protein
VKAGQDIDVGKVIDVVRGGLTVVSGQRSGKDPIITGINVLGELRARDARSTLQSALLDNNQNVVEAAKKALMKLDMTDAQYEAYTREEDKKDAEFMRIRAESAEVFRRRQEQRSLVKRTIIWGIVLGVVGLIIKGVVGLLVGVAIVVLIGWGPRLFKSGDAKP